MRSIVLAAFLLGAGVLATGCTATVAADAYPPDMVYAAPGVQVIADYNEPIFYSDGFYWRYYGGTWYRSSYYTGGWVYAQPPVAVLRIDRPYAYAHYRPHGWVGRTRTVGPGPATGWRGTPTTPAYRGAPPPASGWRGTPTTPAYRGAPPPAAARRPAPGYSAPRAAPAGPPARGAPSHGGGWRGGPH